MKTEYSFFLGFLTLAGNAIASEASPALPVENPHAPTPHAVSIAAASPETNPAPAGGVKFSEPEPVAGPATAAPAAGLPASIAIRKVTLRSLPNLTRVIIETSAEVPHKLAFKTGDTEALVELTGVSAQAFTLSGDFYDDRVAGLWIAEPAALATTVRIGLHGDVARIRSFGLSQLPGIVIDIESGPQGAPPVVLPGAPDASTNSNAGPAAPEDPNRSLYAEQYGVAYPAGRVADYPEDTQRFPVSLLNVKTDAGKKVLAAYKAGEYAGALDRAFELFEAQEGKESRPDELPVLALAAESRYQQELADDTSTFEEALNYYSQFKRQAQDRALRAFADYRIGQIHERRGAPAQAIVAYKSALAAKALPLEETLLRSIGENSLQSRFYNEATEAYRYAALQYPDSPELGDILAGLGDAQLGAGQWARSRDAYKRATGFDSMLETRKPLLHARLGETYEGEGDKPNAIREYLRFFENNGFGQAPQFELDEARLKAASAVAGDGYILKLAPEADVNRAFIVLQDLIHRYNGKPLALKARVELARIGLRHQVSGAPLKIWDDVSEYGSPVKAIEQLSERDLGTENIEPTLVELSGLASGLLAQNRPAEAGEAVFLGLSMSSRGEGARNRELAEAFRSLTADTLRKLYEQGKALEAIAFRQQTMRIIEPADYPREGLYYAGLSYSALGVNDDALGLLLQLENTSGAGIPADALQLHIAEAEAGKAFSRGDKAAEARNRIANLLGNDSNTPLKAKAQALLARCLAHDGENEMAAQAWQQALAIPGLNPTEEMSATLELADLQTTLNRRESALENYLRGLYLFEETRSPYSDSGTARRLIAGLSENFYRVGEWRKAAMMLEQFLAFYPDDSFATAARYYLADSRKRLGDAAGARKLFAELAGDPKAQNYWREIAQALGNDGLAPSGAATINTAATAGQ